MFEVVTESLADVDVTRAGERRAENRRVTETPRDDDMTRPVSGGSSPYPDPAPPPPNTPVPGGGIAGSQARVVEARLSGLVAPRSTATQSQIFRWGGPPPCVVFLVSFLARAVLGLGWLDSCGRDRSVSVG
ncbi:hypothetical protein LCGC14_1151060, partial [marine sediment metagenome]